jgi:transposase-like protein
MNTTNNAPSDPKTLLEAVQYFSDLHVAHSFFANLRWPDGTVCPHCGSRDVRYLAEYRRFQCSKKHPKRQFTVKTGTIMEDSPLSLTKWAVAFWLEANAKNSISSYEVHRALGITQKSAWFMQQRIRLAMQTGAFRKLKGEVEVDESFIGGKARNMHRGARKTKGSGAAGKAAVLGLLERHGEVRTMVVDDTKRRTLQPHVREHVEPKSEVFTDALRSYIGLDANFIHQVIDHAECYAKGKIHTNGLENFWALFKRCIKGTHVSIEPYHLFRYLDSECFRFNNRKSSDGERFIKALRGYAGKRLTFDSLTGKTEPYTRSDSDGENDVLVN